MSPRRVFLTLLCAFIQLGSTGALRAEARQELLHVSYDPTREFFREFNALFLRTEKLGSDELRILQSHGGSGKQARSVIDGLPADVVSLALGGDIDQIARRSGYISKGWRKQFPNDSSPFYSTIVFLVRKGNPKGIDDWKDLTKRDIEIITPNPRTSGGARWNYLAAWAYGLTQSTGNSKNDREEAARKFIRSIFSKVPVLDTSARAAANTFTRNGIGDVLLTWENEAYLALQELTSDEFEIITPSLSIKAEPVVAVVEYWANKHGTLELSHRYLDLLYSKEAQSLAAKHLFRPLHEDAASSATVSFTQLTLITAEECCGNWDSINRRHFADGALFDRAFRP